MKHWFPFTDYDFYAYLTAGMVLIAAIDYTFAGGVLVPRTEWTVVQIAFWTAIAYLVGQLIAAPSATLLEHGIARSLLYPPAEVILGLKNRRWRERLMAWMFAEREYGPLPAQIRDDILIVVAKSLNVDRSTITDPEIVFQVAYPVARKSADAVARMDQFRNLYGFSRNLSFVALIATILLVIRLANHGGNRTAWLLAGAAFLCIGMFGRFLKFYAAFSYEVLRTYHSLSSTAPPAPQDNPVV
jgi:hypothetical protein